jgi:2-polyprenyl-6-methoxyphenol hydroxylase-like FAD-dependent oxidoreductase
MAWPRVLIAGGSIGGLTAAVLLRDLRCEVDVYERSNAALEDRGAGIVVLPITERYFTERGGEDDRVSLELTYWTMSTGTGPSSVPTRITSGSVAGAPSTGLSSRPSARTGNTSGTR